MSKVALVTGASRGLGRAIALRLAKDGMTVIVHYGQHQAAADEVVSEIAALGSKAIALLLMSFHFWHQRTVARHSHSTCRAIS